MSATTINTQLEIVITANDATYDSVKLVTVPRDGVITGVTTIGSATGTVDLGTALDPDGIIDGGAVTADTITALTATGGYANLSFSAGDKLSVTTIGGARGKIVIAFSVDGATLDETAVL